MEKQNNSSENLWIKIRKMLSNIIFALFMGILMILIYVAVKGISTGSEPEIFNYKLYYVDSGSMSPTIKIGSLIIVEKQETAAIDLRDIVTFRTESGTVVTHRLVGENSSSGEYVTRGDANDSDDPSFLKKESIIGKVVLTIPYIGFFFSMLKTSPFIGISILSVITIFIIISVVYDSKRKRKIQISNQNKKIWGK
jgi:signal peptidase